MTLKVSSEMIAAGVAALWPCEISATEIEAEVVTRVFEAMQQVGNKAYQRDYHRRKRLRVGEGPK